LGLGRVYEQRQQYAAAAAYFSEGVHLMKQANDEFYLAQAIHQLGLAQQGLADSEDAFRRAKECFDESLHIKEPRGDTYGIAIAHECFGTWYEDPRNPLREPRKAIDAFRRSLIIQETMGYSSLRSMVLVRCGIARASAELADWGTAAEELAMVDVRLTKAEAENRPDEEMRALFHHSSGRVAMLFGDLTKAHDDLNKALIAWRSQERPLRVELVKDWLSKLVLKN
jgi:tetratricopeptide (TPR) repeat protein